VLPIVPAMSRNIVFVAPFPTDVTYRFVRACRTLPDIKLLGVMHTPPKGKDAKLFDDKVRVENPMNTADLIAGVAELRRRWGHPDRIICILENMQVQVAEVREHFGVPGTSREVAELFRDKSRMKAALNKAGLPTAKNRVLRGMADVKAFVDEVGFPIVIKPLAGLGSKSTFRVASLVEATKIIEGLGVGDNNPVLGEEFLSGREFSFETITVGGKPQVHSISTYHPTCLDAVEHPWIQWCCVLPKDISGPEFDPIRPVGFGAIKALGLQDGMTHMEWFQRKDGSVAIGEIAQRPAGANISIMNCYAHDVDLYRAWCRAVVDGEFDKPWERKWSVGTAFLRGMGRGRVAGATGIGEVHKMFGKSICEAKIPDVGAPKSDSYEGDGYIVVRDAKTENVKEMLNTIINTVRIYYSA
jgi:biotin carboxylase